MGQLESVATTGIDLLKVSDLEECVSLRLITMSDTIKLLLLYIHYYIILLCTLWCFNTGIDGGSVVSSFTRKEGEMRHAPIN